MAASGFRLRRNTDRPTDASGQKAADIYMTVRSLAPTVPASARRSAVPIPRQAVFSV